MSQPLDQTKSGLKAISEVRAHLVLTAGYRVITTFVMRLATKSILNFRMSTETSLNFPEVTPHMLLTIVMKVRHFVLIRTIVRTIGELMYFLIIQRPPVECSQRARVCHSHQSHIAELQILQFG